MAPACSALPATSRVTVPRRAGLLPCLLALAAAAWLLSAIPATAAENTGQWLLTAYVGRYTDQHLYEDILGQRSLHFEDAWLFDAALAKPFSCGPSHCWEAEGQVGKYAGAQTQWEFNGLAIWRWTDFPWNAHLATTAALGDGLSYDTVVPPLELASHTNEGARRLLNYFLIETTFAPPWAEDWSLVVRVHHRSGVFGFLGGVHGGSNDIGVGLKWAF